MIRFVARALLLSSVAFSSNALAGDPVEPLSAKSVILEDEYADTGGWEVDLSLNLWTVNMTA